MIPVGEHHASIKMKFLGQNPQFFWPAGADVNADVDDDVDDDDDEDDDDDDDDDEAAFTALGTTPQLLPNKPQLCC